uniref:Uncharacterized protein n=1 Tax=Acrobeloides nanus TaxID=290746 RepID=A0A914D3I0_9BILA
MNIDSNCIGLSANIAAAPDELPIPECPLGTPEKCKCGNDEGKFRVLCENAINSKNIQNLFTSIINEVIDRLSISCSEPLEMVPRLPAMNLKRLEIVGCEALHLINNSMKSIPVFGLMPKLESLNLDRNEISEVPENAFKGLPQLRHLRLQYNKICTLSNDALAETKTRLELLDLSGNCLSIIPSPILRGFDRLMYMDLAENQFTEVGPLGFMQLPLLKELRLNSNRLERIAPNAFVDMPQLKTLYLRDNVLPMVDSSMIQGFKQLEVLDLSRNMLNQTPSFKEMVNLKQVRLDYNKLRVVDAYAFSANIKLELINLQNNEISKIDKNGFDSLEQLTTLLLANNSLTKLDGSIFATLPNLQNLNLHQNNISSIDNTTFATLPKLAVLDLSSNGLEHIGVGAFSKQPPTFYWLDLSNNKLKSFDKGVFDQKITNILLNGNPLVCDDKMDWFVHYMVVNQIRTSRPNEPEIKCSAPDEFAGVRLKELMIKKSSKTLTASMQRLGLDGSAQPNKNFLTNLFPGLANLGDIQNLGVAKANC